MSILLKGVDKLKNSMPALELIEKLLGFFTKSKIDKKGLGESVEKFNYFYSSLTDFPDKIRQPKELATFTKCSEILIKI